MAIKYNMEFYTHITIPKTPFTFSYTVQTVLLGSCFAENIGKADRHISRMIHDAGGYFQIQSVIGMPQVLSFGIVGSGKVYLSS